MREPLAAATFADQVGVPLERVERVTREGLLDPDGDGLFDDLDVLRMAIVTAYETQGIALGEIREELEKPEKFLSKRLFRLGGERYSFADVAAQTDLTIEQLAQMAIAGGFERRLHSILLRVPDLTLDSVDYSELAEPLSGVLDEHDVESLHLAKRFLDAGISWDGIIESIRVYGDVLRRLSQMEVNLVHRFMCEPLAAQGMEDAQISAAFYTLGADFATMANDVLLHFHDDMFLDALVDHALRHLEEESPGSIPGSMDATIVFIDLSLFTSLAHVHGDELAAQVLDTFDTIVRKAALLRGGRVVKQIGDAFMLTFGDPVDAVRFGTDVLGEAAVVSDFPALRIGMHYGPVLYRVGDYVGNVVNTASRLTTMAMPNVILMTREVADPARAAGLGIEEVGMRTVRGVDEPVVIYRLGVEVTPHRDPVCGMVVRDGGAGRLTHEGRTVYFCSQGCLRKFLDAPENYLHGQREAG